jgi:hypothetical protein
MTMRIALLTTTLLGLALAGCGESNGTWTKQGSAPYQSVSAQKQCLEQANKLGFLDTGGGPRGGLGTAGSSDSSYSRNHRNDMYRLCMADRGYSKVRDTDEDAAPAGQAE